MKVMNKQRIFDDEYQKYAKTERDILALVNDSAFIVKLYFAFQNRRSVFLLLEYCPCGDLGGVLKKEKRFSEEVARLYLC